MKKKLVDQPIYAYWERSLVDNDFNLVFYHRSMPPKSANSNDRERSAPYEVPKHMILGDGKVNTESLLQHFPKPN